MSLPTHRHSLNNRLALLASACLLVTACGGGGGDTTPAATSSSSTGGSATTTTTSATTTPVYSQGAITGLGSIIVNGLRIDDSSATVEDDEGRSRGRDDLLIGTQVEVESHTAGSAQVADRVRLDGAITGPVESIDTVAGTLRVLGQTVVVSTTTIFDTALAAGLSAVRVGSVIEVHAALDITTGQYRATRIEAESSVTEYALKGLVANLNTTTKAFDIGAAHISYASLTTAPALANGDRIKVRLSTTPSSGTWTALRIRAARTAVATASEAHVRGLVSALTDGTHFTVDGVQVDASNATFPDGTTGIAVGTALSVEGQLQAGVLLATKVEIDARHSADDSRRPELHGAPTAVDRTASTMVVRGVTVSWNTSTQWRDGSEANLAVNGRSVEVKGTWNATGTIVQATRIQFE